jgi:hypothetical protein
MILILSVCKWWPEKKGGKSEVYIIENILPQQIILRTKYAREKIKEVIHMFFSAEDCIICSCLGSGKGKNSKKGLFLHFCT